MDRRPLLSSTRESSRRAASQPPLLPPQVDRSFIVFEDDVGEANNDNNSGAAGSSSDVRNSIFSSLSFSAWSDSAAGVQRSGAATSGLSYFFSMLFRPFQRLGFWCFDGERCPTCCSCWCLGRSSGLSSSPSHGGLHHSENDDFDGPSNEIVTADALRASGVSQGSHGGKSGGTPTTVPHHGSSSGGGGGSGRPHRQYAPPRSHSTETGFGPASSSALTPAVDGASGALDNADAQQLDSVTGSSFAGSSTPPSTAALGRFATAPGEQLVMQRGVLMRITADGSCTRVEEPTVDTLGGRGTQRGVPRTSSLEEGEEGRSQFAQPAQALQLQHFGMATPRPGNTDGEGNLDPYELAAAMRALEAARQSLSTLEQLSSALTRFAPYLPLRVETEVDLNSSTALVAEGQKGTTASQSTPTAPALPLCVHVLGPVQSCQTATALRVLEDVLLEDCDSNRICINALHCADLDLRGVTLSTGDTLNLSGRPGSIANAEEGRQRVQSNAFLDLLVSPVTAAARGSGGWTSHGAGERGAAPTTPVLTAADASTHLLAFLSTIVKGRGPQLSTLHFTRCFVAPHDMARFVPLPLSTVRRLRYEHCSLTPAHIDALLTLARYQDAERRSGARGPTAARVAAFGALEELQLSGPLTPECVAELLDFIEEQQLFVTEGRSAPVALRQLILPSALVRAAREHPFVLANYQRMSVVSAR